MSQPQVGAARLDDAESLVDQFLQELLRLGELFGPSSLAPHVDGDR